MTQRRTSAAPDASRCDDYPRTCVEAQALVFRLRRDGLPLLPGLTTDLWAESILAWAGHPKKCRGVIEVAA